MSFEERAKAQDQELEEAREAVRKHLDTARKLEQKCRDDEVRRRLNTASWQ